MLFYIIFIVVVFIIIFEKANETSKKGKNPNYRTPEYTNPNKGKVNNTLNQLGNAAQEQLSEAQKRYQQRLQEYQAKQQIRPTQQNRIGQPARPMQQNIAGQPAKSMQQSGAGYNNKDIVSRAKNNTDKLKEDTTLKEIEKSHSHSEKQISKPVEHSQVCQSHLHNEDVIVPGESLLGSVEDLMIKGYDGNLQFERDFVGEALDMVANFSIQNVSLDNISEQDVSMQDIQSVDIANKIELNDMKKGA